LGKNQSKAHIAGGFSIDYR